MMKTDLFDLALVGLLLGVTFTGAWRARKLVNDSLAEMASGWHLAPGRLPPMSETTDTDTNDFEKQTVDEFLRRALDPKEVFTAKEWADQDEDPQPKKDGGRRVKKAKSHLPDIFEPPVARMYCTGCKNHWDAWVNDDGSLQDSRDAHCACDKGGFVTLTDEE